MSCRLDRTALFITCSEVKGTCDVTSNSANICDRMESSKDRRTKQGQPDSEQIWLPWFSGLILGASSTCDHYYAAPKGKSYRNRERRDPAPLLHISSFVSASVESPHLCGKASSQAATITGGLNVILLGPNSVSLLGFTFISFFSFLLFSCFKIQFLISVSLNYSQ